MLCFATCVTDLVQKCCACVYMQVYCTLKNGNGSFTECILGCVNHMFMYSVSAIGQIETDDKWYISQIA